MKLLLCLIIAFSFCKTFKCLPVVVNSTETFAYPIVNAPVRGVSNVNDTDRLLFVENDTLLYTPSQNVDVPRHTVQLNNTDAMEMLHMFENASDIFEIITNDGERIKAYKSIMKRCSSAFKNFLRNGTINTWKFDFSADVTQKMIQFCNSQSIDYIGNAGDDLSEISFAYGIPLLKVYIANMESKATKDQLNADKENRERLEAKEKERLEAMEKERLEALDKETNSSKKNSYVSEVLVLQIVLLFISRFY